MTAPNRGAGSLGPCRQLRVRLLQISTESSRERTTPPATPPATTTSSPPPGASWVVQVWPVLACTMALAGTSSVAVRNQDLLVILVFPSSPASPVVEPPAINLYCGITTLPANISILTQYSLLPVMKVCVLLSWTAQWPASGSGSRTALVSARPPPTRTLSTVASVRLAASTPPMTSSCARPVRGSGTRTLAAQARAERRKKAGVQAVSAPRQVWHAALAASTPAAEAGR